MRLNLKVLKNRDVFLAFVMVALVIIGAMIVFGQKPVQANWLVILTTVLNVLVFLRKVYSAIKARPFSFDLMVWLFNLFFFGYVPLAQHLCNRYAWNLVPSAGEIVRANIYVLVWSAVYTFARKYRLTLFSKLQNRMAMFFKAKKEKACTMLDQKVIIPLRIKLQDHKQKLDTMSVDVFPAGTLQDRAYRTFLGYRKKNLMEKALDLLLLISVVLTVIDLSVVGLAGQFSRNTSGIGGGSVAMSLLLTHGLNNTILFVASLFVFSARMKRRISWKTIVALLCLGVACFPTGLSRNMMASFYAGLIVMIPKTKKGRWFSVVILVGLVLVFPAVEVFRRASTLQNGNIFKLFMNSIQSSFLGGHFDAHQNIVTISRYVDEFGVSWGQQLLGSLLFFVPRAIWPNKPTGTGYTAILALEQSDFANVSAPQVAEGYVNFGLIGVILFAWIVGSVTRKLDKSYWKPKKQLRLIDMLYPHAMFMFFFFLRGDMMSSWAYTFAQCFVGTCVYVIYWFCAQLSFGKTVKSEGYEQKN